MIPSILELKRNKILLEWWGYYLEDLNVIFNTGEITAKEFFSKYKNQIVNSFSYWYDMLIERAFS